ncbi:fibronectin type III domain-containing protein [Flagellimonas sp. S174]|uniref:fibronectin type III domain-containing protein n=1 Tax=Flagellimonas sp. S174 TaxID=3410790 RepID=UPI003BF4D776
MENRGIVLRKWRMAISMVLLVLFSTMNGNAQSFPVNITVQTLGAAPTQLSSYADAAQNNGPLRITLALNDLNITGREVQLRLFFQGGGINFQSTTNPIGAGPFFLDGGIPLTLNALEIAPYFEVSNLTGISPTVYGRTLPEGSYQICFEVFDVLTGNRLSTRSCASVFIFRNRPPFLVLPHNGVQVDQANPQNIVFQWMPRQLNVTNVEYELSLVELWDNGIDPQAAFLATPPIFQTSTRATSYLYGPADPILLPNHAYAWRVQAKAVDGAEAIGLFENQGYSEIFSFVHLAPCEVPPNLRHEVRGSGQANILWDDPSTEIPEFTVRYRQKGEGNAWFLNRTTANWTTLWDLKPGTRYEYQLKKDCGLGESDWSLVRQFSTALETEVEELHQCGISPSINIQNQEPLSSLLPGQQFVAGDFTVITTQVNGGEGYYSGKGFVRIPYLGNVKLAVYFDNILLNTDRQLLQGTVITEYDPTMRNIVDTRDVVETVGELVDAAGDLLEELFSQKEELLNQLAEAESFEEQQNFISQINDLEVTIDQQIDAIHGKENLPASLQQELEELKLEGNIATNEQLTSQEIEQIKTADAQRRDRIREIADIAERGEFTMIADRIWFMPDWTPFKLPESVSNSIVEASSQTVIGTVPGLRYNGIPHEAKYSENGAFEGYYANGTKAPINPLDSINDTAKVYLYKYLPNECDAIFETTFKYADSLRPNVPYNPQNENIKRVYISKCLDSVFARIEQPTSIVLNIGGSSEIITTARQDQYVQDEAFEANKRVLDFAGLVSQGEKDALADQMGNIRILEGTLMHFILTDEGTQPTLINEFLELVPDAGTYYRWIHFEGTGKVIINDKTPAGFEESLKSAAYHWTQDYWDNLELNTNRGTREFLFGYMVQVNLTLSSLAGLLAEIQIDQKYWDAADSGNYVQEMEYVARLFSILRGEPLNVFNAEQSQLQFAFYCGIFNGMMEELTGLVQLGDMLTEYVTDAEAAKSFDLALNSLNLTMIWSQFQNAHGVDSDGNLNQYVLAHQLGKDLVFVASLFVGIGELTSVSGIGQVLRNLENLVDLARLTKARRLKNAFPDGWDKLRTLAPVPDNFWNKLDGLGEAQGRFLADFDAQQLQRFVENPNLVDSWKKALDNGLPELWRKDLDFLGKLRNVWDYNFVNGTNVKLPNVLLEPTQLTKVSTEVLQQMRNTFNSTVKKNFLKGLGNNPNINSMLKKAGFSDGEIPILIQRLQNGQGIPGYQVHHKIPIDLGGSNDFSNLVLMKQTPYHSAVTSFQNSQISIPVGQTQTLNFPKVEGSFYSPPYIE